MTLTTGACGAVSGAYAMVDIPAPHPEAVVQSTVFLDDRGDYVGRRGPVDRQEVPLSRVPRHVQEAVIAAENRSFRTDSGIAPSSIARAAWAGVSGGARQGGSTITQQYVKNALLTPEQSFSRKAREAMIAVKMDRTRSKDEILEGYLNTVYFGRGAAGIESAARNYFGVSADRLSLEEGAALAAIINLPSYYERAGGDRDVTTTLRRRWAWVLDGMVLNGTLTAAERAGAVFPAFRFYPSGKTEGQRQYLLDVAAAEAADRLHISPEELARGGYRVHTTFDLALQDRATQAVQARSIDSGPARRAPVKARLHTSVVGVVPGDGAIRALYGGSDYARQPFNDALSGAVETGTALDALSVGLSRPPLDALRRKPTATPVEVTAAYAAEAAGGRYTTPYTIARITRGGKTLYQARPAPARESGGGEAPVDGPVATHTGGAGDRTAWSTSWADELALGVALFAEEPPERGRPAAAARLTPVVGEDPRAMVTRLAADIRPAETPRR
ncbi:transglycosylase domain-containing protein [Streptomyces sp. NPDC057675]|uniref:transglycosylase domain-containing protein n=1 Tax=Streptomyces sp. NPDC057675 TaxID=3346204 RepID=UPI0036BA5B35